MKQALIAALIVVVAAACGGVWFLTHPRDPLVAARQRLSHGDMRGAELYLRQAVGRHPHDPEINFLLGTTDLSLGNPQAAELSLRRARDFGHEPNAIVLPLGQAYLQQRHFDEALRDFDPAKATPAQRADVMTVRAAAQLSLGDVEAATASAAQAEAAAPTRRETLLTAGRVALARGDLDGANARAARMLAETPNEPDALLLRAEVELRRNNAKAALADAQTVLALSLGRLDARMVEARAMAALGRIDAARADVAGVLAAAPKNVGANYLGAMLAVQQGDYPTADAELTQIDTVIGKLPRGDYFLAATKLGMGQPAQAAEAINRFLATRPDDVAGLKLLTFVDLFSHKAADALAVLRQPALANHPDADTLDLLGRAQAASGDIADAQGSFTKASKLAPGDAAILNRLAAAQLTLGDVAAAETDLRQSLKLAPNQPLAGEAIVQADLARGDYRGAADDVDRLRKAVGDGEAVGVLAAQVKIASLDMAGAEAQLRDVLRRFPGSRAATLTLVRIDGLRGDNAAAEAELEALLRRHPDDKGALTVLLAALTVDKQFDRAVAVAEAAHAAAPDDADVTSALATAYVRAHQAARASALLDRTGAERTPRLDALRAQVLAADGKPDQAEQAYRDVLRESPDDEGTRIALAGLLIGQKRFDDAVAVLDEGLAQHPGNPGLLGAIVGIDLRRGGIRQALATAAKLQADPQNLPAAYVLPGEAWLAAGNTREAATAFASAYRMAPSGELAIRAATALSGSGSTDRGIAILSGWAAGHPDDIQAQSVLSSLYIGVNRLGDAEQHLDLLVAHHHADPVTLNNLAWIKNEQGDKDQARALAERAYFQAPGPQMADTLGWILVRQGDASRALPLLAQAATDQSPGSQAISLYHYGVALDAVGRHDEARTELQRAVDAKTDFPDKAAARTLLSTLH